MGIVYKKGCLIEGFKSGEVRVIGHQANCQNTMNSGVAKAIRLAFPEAYEADCGTVRGDYSKLGGISTCINNNGIIVNIYGQYNYGYDGIRYTDYEALESGFNHMIDMLTYIEYQGKIGLPKLGCDRGGGDWNIVEGLIKETLAEKHDVIIYVR